MKDYLPFIILLALLGCSSPESDPVDLAYDYVPLAQNRFWVYEVDETIYFGESDKVTTHFFYRDVVTSSFFDNEGDLVYLIVRTKSLNQNEWDNHSVYTLQIKSQALIRSVENQKNIPLVFPPKDQVSWDGNAYNSQQEDNYQLEYIQAYEVGSKTYQGTVKVVQEEDDDLITIRDKRFEVFARGVGMIEQYYEVLTYCSRNDCLGEQIIDSGRFTHLRLINNGQY
ncbi:hypothetical protein GCM10028791_30240 [Echinicola sediminis]